MPIGVLQTLTRQRGATGGRTHDETSRHLVTRSPHGVAGALETKHGVKHVDRHHRFAMGGIAGSHRGEGREGARFVDAGVQNLTLGAFLVGQQKFAIDRGVALAVRVIDLSVKRLLKILYITCHKF